jgi:hypothetical protein
MGGCRACLFTVVISDMTNSVCANNIARRRLRTLKLMPTKTQIERAERHWRHFVFDSRFTRVFFFCGVIVFLSGVVVTSMERVATIWFNCFLLWFSCFLLYIVSAYLLTLIVSFIRRDVITTLCMAAWTFGLAFIACRILASAFRGGFAK